MFRSPNDVSSSESSSDEEIEVSRISSRKSATEDGPSSSPSQHANLITASLLEFHYHQRAADLLNSANKGAHYDRDSPEAKSLAMQMFAKSSQQLASHGLVAKDLHSDDLKEKRQQFLTGLDTLGVEALREAGTLPPPPKLTLEALPLVSDGDHNLTTRSVAGRRDSFLSFINEISIPTPLANMQLATPLNSASHYTNQFAEIKILGRGGFGTVYHVVNHVDNQHYAIKKIGLDPRRVKESWQDGVPEEMKHVLREVRTLAMLEHSNIVRYYGAWFEGPSNRQAGQVKTGNTQPTTYQKLLRDKPEQAEDNGVDPVSEDDGIIFGEDSVPQHSNSESHIENEATSSTISLSNETDIFTDGDGRNIPVVQNRDVGQVVLCLQMSLHPMNLATYLSPRSSSPSPSALQDSVNVRHCFHLQPSLSIFLGILAGVQYLHSRGIIHRDIKPANIFLSEDCVPRPGFGDARCVQCPDRRARYLNTRIGDFGLVGNIAEDPEESTSASARIVGTELYRPPPRHLADNNNGKANSNVSKVDEKLDVFALGVLLFELLYPLETRTERSIVLNALTRSSTLPDDFAGRVCGLPYTYNQKKDISRIENGQGMTIVECVKGMVHNDPAERWQLQRVVQSVERSLRMCRRLEQMEEERRVMREKPRKHSV